MAERDGLPPMIRTYVRLTLLTTLIGACSMAALAQRRVPQAEQETSAYVFVDQTDPAYVLMQGIPASTSAESMTELREQAARRNGTIISWDQFSREVGDYARSKIVRNDYPQFNVVTGVTCLVRNSPGSSWAIVWNAGIALTASDYTTASALYQDYQRNPSGYRPDRRGGRLNPGGFLPLYGCLR